MASTKKAVAQPTPKKQTQAVTVAKTYKSSQPSSKASSSQPSSKASSSQSSTQKTTKNEQVLKDALKNVGPTLSTYELERIKKDTGIKGGVIPFAASLGIKPSYGVQQQTKGSKEGAKGSKEGGPKIPGFTGSSMEGYTPAMFEGILAQNLASLGGNISADVARIMADSEIEKAKIANRGLLKSTKITTESSDYATDAEERSDIYESDRQLESILGAENIRSKGAVDLQSIINAGAANVENIRSKGALNLQGLVNTGAANVENIRGKYGVEGRKIDRRAAILSSLTSAFNF